MIQGLKALLALTTGAHGQTVANDVRLAGGVVDTAFEVLGRYPKIARIQRDATLLLANLHAAPAVSGSDGRFKEGVLEALQRAQMAELLGRKGGVHIVFADQIGADRVRLLESTARVTLDDVLRHPAVRKHSTVQTVHLRDVMHGAQRSDGDRPSPACLSLGASVERGTVRYAHMPLLALSSAERVKLKQALLSPLGNLQSWIP